VKGRRKNNIIKGASRGKERTEKGEKTNKKNRATPGEVEEREDVKNNRRGSRSVGGPIRGLWENQGWTSQLCSWGRGRGASKISQNEKKDND